MVCSDNNKTIEFGCYLNHKTLDLYELGLTFYIQERTDQIYHLLVVFIAASTVAAQASRCSGGRQND